VFVTLDVDREDEGRVIAEVLDLPGVLAYGATQEEAVVVRARTRRRGEGAYSVAPQAGRSIFSP